MSANGVVMGTEEVTVDTEGAANEKREKTSPKLAFGYGMGEFANQMSWYIINNYLTLFYTDVVGLAASSISLIMLIARVWDAVNDPMMGAIADKTNTRWGKFRPFLMFTPPFFAIFNILTFTVFPVTGALKVFLCLICYIGAGMAYTVIGTAQSALVNVIAIDSQTRMNLSTARGIGSAVVSFLLSAVAMPMILFFGKSDVATGKGFLWTTVVLSLVSIPCFLIEVVCCKEKYTEKLHNTQKEAAEKTSFVSQLKELLKNDQLTAIVISTFFGAICVTARMSLLSYYVIYVVGSYKLISVVFALMTGAQFVGTLLIPVMTPILGKKKYMLVLTWAMIISFVLIFFFGAKSMPILMICSFMCGLANSSGALSYGFVSDTIEYGAWKTGKRQEGLAASFLSLAVKCATAFCGVTGVLLLAAVGYKANMDQTEAAKVGISFVVNIIPAICGIGSILPLKFYKLTEEKVGEIRAELEKREAMN